MREEVVVYVVVIYTWYIDSIYLYSFMAHIHTQQVKNCIGGRGARDHEQMRSVIDCVHNTGGAEEYLGHTHVMRARNIDGEAGKALNSAMHSIFLLLHDNIELFYRVAASGNTCCII